MIVYDVSFKVGVKNFRYLIEGGEFKFHFGEFFYQMRKSKIGI